jgi:hypothetical protein
MIPASTRTENLGRAARPAIPGIWAPCLSALCLLHCAGTALLVPFVPALAAFAELAWLEWALLAAAAVSMIWVLLRVLRVAA